MNHDAHTPLDPEPSTWPVLVTGASGFVGGHVARHLALAGHHVRGLVRGQPVVCPGDPRIEWVVGDLRQANVRRRAVAGVRGVIHAAGWVSLGRDPHGLSRTINVDATCALLDNARQAGVERFVLTSTLHTLAAGTPDAPAEEATPWNLHGIDSPYARTKREAEQRVCQASDSTFTTVVLCPGMVIGPRDPKPTSTRLLSTLARTRMAVVPRGGIPMVDAEVLARAHRRALEAGQPGERYAVVGPYVTYAELARLVAEITGRPRIILLLPDILERPLKGIAALVDGLGFGAEFSPATVAGGFLHLHVSGRRANACFGLEHPPPVESVRAALAARSMA